MNEENTQGKQEEILERINSLEHELQPAPGLEERIVKGLQREGLIRSGLPTQARLLHPVLAAVAALVFLATGMLLQNFRQISSSNSMSENTYVVFLKKGHEYKEARNEKERRERIEQYRNWARDIKQKGVAISGTKLRDEIHFLGRGPTVKESEIVSGYFLIDAGSLQEAIRLSRTCPHLLYGGAIEVRRVDPV